MQIYFKAIGVIIIFAIIYLFWFANSEHNTNISLKPECIIEGEYLIVKDTLQTNKIVCVFNQHSCPTCILEVKRYSKLVSDDFDLVFYTDKFNNVNLNFIESAPKTPFS